MGAMTGAKAEALELIRSLKEQYPDETEDQLISRFLKELEGDQALKHAPSCVTFSTNCFKN
jgi:hypothetical protein